MTQDLLSLVTAVSVEFVPNVSHKRWVRRHHHELTDSDSDPISSQSSQESINLEDIYKMRDKLRMHEQLRIQEQLKMQQELLQKQQLWMQQQLQKQSLRIGKATDNNVNTPILDTNPTTTEEISYEINIGMPKQHVTEKETIETRVTKTKRKQRIVEDSEENYQTKKKKHHHSRHRKEKKSITVDHHSHEAVRTLKDSPEEVTETYVTTPIPHQIKYNQQVQLFSTQILNLGKRIFVQLKNKTANETVLKILDQLDRMYEEKFREFLNETSLHEIKTRLGSQKVVLDSVDVSNRILKRLVNKFVSDLDVKGSLRQNLDTVNDLMEEVHKGADSQYGLLCSKMNVCRSSSGFSEFLSDFFTIILRCDDTKFQTAIDALTEVARDMDFRNVFRKKTRKKIKRVISYVETQKLDVLRPSLLILRNIVAKKNRPIIIKPSEVKRSRVNSTIALLEILNTFDTTLPRSDANILKWGDIRSSLHDWERNRRDDVQDIMGMFMRHIKEALDSMPSTMQEHIAKNFEKFNKT